MTATASDGRAEDTADPADADALLSVSGLRKHFPVVRGLRRQTVAAVKAVDGLDFSVRPGETLGLVGESGCGKTTTGTPAGPAGRAHRRHHPIPGQGHHAHQGQCAPTHPPGRPDGVPGPLLVIEPPAHGGHDRGSAVPAAEDQDRPGHQAHRPGPARAGRAQPRALQPLSARVLRRPAPAHRDRPLARPAPEADHRRRAGVRPRRLHPGADHQPDGGSAGRARTRPTS